MDTNPPLTIRQLRAISAVAHHASLARAAEHLNTSASTLSRYVAEAEQSLSVRLFQRGWLGMEPTSEGAAAIGRVRLVIAAIANAQEALRASGGRVADLSHHLTWRMLDVVAGVTRHGSASAAAAALRLSQPDVSRSLAKLAAAIGRPPFRRSRKGLVATSDAHILADLRTTILSQLVSLSDELKALSNEVTGRVAVGLLPFSEQDLVARVFGRMLKPYRHVRLQAVTGTYGALTEALRRGELDVLVGPLREPAPFDDLSEVRLFEEAFALVARASHPCLDSPTTLEGLMRQDWLVAPHGTPTRAYFENLLHGHGLTPPAHTCEVVTFFLAEHVLLNSDAIGLLTYSSRKRDPIREGLATLAIDLPGNVRQIGMTTRKGHQPTAAQSIFTSMLVAEAGMIPASRAEPTTT